jgi:hypothetical protein
MISMDTASFQSDNPRTGIPGCGNRLYLKAFAGQMLDQCRDEPQGPTTILVLATISRATGESLPVFSSRVIAIWKHQHHKIFPKFGESEAEQKLDEDGKKAIDPNETRGWPAHVLLEKIMQHASPGELKKLRSTDAYQKAAKAGIFTWSDVMAINRALREKHTELVALTPTATAIAAANGRFSCPLPVGLATSGAKQSESKKPLKVTPANKAGTSEKANSRFKNLNLSQAQLARFSAFTDHEIADLKKLYRDANNSTEEPGDKACAICKKMDPNNAKRVGSHTPRSAPPSSPL